MSVAELAKQEKIPYGTLYTWKQLHIAKTSHDEEPKREMTSVSTKHRQCGHSCFLSKTVSINSYTLG